jgi:hypothetical protein
MEFPAVAIGINGVANFTVFRRESAAETFL